MTKAIQTTETTLQPIRDTSRSLPRITPEQVRQALGAEETPAELVEALAPVTLFAVREELVNRLQSSGGRPALAGTSRRAKIPLSDEEWMQLEELAAAIGELGFAPSAGQVASVLLRLSLHAVVAQVASAPSGSRLGKGKKETA